MNNKIYFQTKLLSIYNEDILKIKDVKQSSVDLIVTSPPYNVDIKYNSHNDKISYKEYLEFTRNWLRKCCELPIL